MDRLKLLLLGLILLGCIIVPLATKAAVRDLTDRQVAMLLPPLWLAPALPGAPRSHLGDIEAPYRADGIATADIDLDSGNFSLILDDGATGAGNLAFYFGQDTDLGCYRSGTNTLACEGSLTLTGVMSNPDGDLCFGAACDAAGTTGNVTFGGTLTTFDNGAQFDGTTTFTAGALVGHGQLFYLGTSNAGFFQSNTVQTPDTTVFGTSALSNSLVIMEGADVSVDFAHALQTNPTIFGHSADATDTTQWWSLTHDQTIPQLNWGSGATLGLSDYTRHHDVPIGAAIVGATAPGVETIGTFRCVVFDANADLAYINVEVPSEWNGSSDMAIDLLVFTDQGDALGSGEIIEFDLVYRSVAVGEAYDNGTAVTILANVTGGGAEVDKGQYKITATVDYDDTDQPLAINDTLGFSLMRDVTTGDTYSGDVHVCRAQLVYTANALATH